MNTTIMFSHKSDEWRTPPEVFEPLNAEFGFTLDVAADSANHLCPLYYTAGDNALIKPWAPEVCWMNPPYSMVKEFLAKAVEERAKGAVVVGLLPGRTDTKWFHSYVYGKAEVRFIKGRVKFISPDSTQGQNSAPFPSIVVVWR